MRQETSENNRVAILRISREFFAEFLKPMIEGFNGPIKVIKNPLPFDSKVVGISPGSNGTLIILIKSESFDQVKVGEDIPHLLPPMFEII